MLLIIYRRDNLDLYFGLVIIEVILKNKLQH